VGCLFFCVLFWLVLVFVGLFCMLLEGYKIECVYEGG